MYRALKQVSDPLEVPKDKLIYRTKLTLKQIKDSMSTTRCGWGFVLSSDPKGN